MLTSQYVYNDMLERRLFRVVSGSGMGQRTRGERVDFYFGQNRNWAAALEVLSNQGIRLYVRYRDDVLVAYDKPYL